MTLTPGVQMADLAEAEEALTEREDELEAAQRAMAEQAAAAAAAAEAREAEPLAAEEADDGAPYRRTRDGAELSRWRTCHADVR
jgi:hypothetical protein